MISFPICFPKEGKLRGEIIEIVDTLIKLSAHDLMVGDTLQAIAQLEQRLDNAIFNLYQLNEAERDLILDLCEVNLEFLYRDRKSDAARSVERLSRFRRELLRIFPARGGKSAGLKATFMHFSKCGIEK